MFVPRKRLMAALVAASVLAAVEATAQSLTGVPSAQPKIVGVTLPTILSPQLDQIVRAQGSTKVENPNPASAITYYGYLDDHSNMLPAMGSNVERSKTEPDKNVYLILRGLTGFDRNYDYGSHFLYQGHEAGRPGSITRINLDADATHRVTVLANFDKDGVPLPPIDGITWYPWAQRLLVTQEGNGSSSGGVWQATADYPSRVESLAGIFGRGGYEGIQADPDGNIWIVEDIGGSTVAGARLPNSFIYRFKPRNLSDLTQGGVLQALQVISQRSGQPIAFQSASALNDDIKDLHTYGLVFDTKWVTLHDTAVEGFAPYNANQLAKDKKATPFKRPENGQFRPGSGFREFFFDETGDTSATSMANAEHGGFGSIMKLSQAGPSAERGKLTMFFKCDLEHTGFDNVAFFDEHRVVFVEDRGDGLHAQGNALDSGWMFDTRLDYSNPAHQPKRIMAQGRDPSATIDSGLSGTPGFQNDGDNEITGIHVSDGDAGTDGLLGAKLPRPFREGWRVFYTQQHGDNVTWEIVRAKREYRHDDDDRDD